MNQRIYIFYISLFTCISVFAQQKEQALIDKNKEKEADQLFVGIDFFNPFISCFSDKSNFNGYLSYKIKKRWSAIIQVGYEKNKYKKLDWDLDAKGIFGEIGTNYILTDNFEKNAEGFYLGGRVGFSPYKQTIHKFPIKGINENGQIVEIGSGSLPKANVNSTWLGFLAGAKVQISELPLFIDFWLEPKFLIYSQKQKKIDNLVIPGYGKNNNIMNISLFWGISYKIL